MGRIKHIDLKVNAVDKREDIYHGLVQGVTKLGNIEASMVVATALVYNSINLFKGVFSVPVREDVEDLNTVAVELLFELNDYLPVNVELVKLEISNVLDRLIPEVDTDRIHMITYNRLLTTANIPDSAIVDSIDSQLYYSDSIFTAVRRLFSIESETVVYDEESNGLFMR